jgi:streptogramin lyase
MTQRSQRRVVRRAGPGPVLGVLAVVVASGIALSALSATPSGAASRRTSRAAPDAARCSFSATVHFSPPLTTAGGGTGASKIKATLTGCTTSFTDYQISVPKGILVGSFAQSPFACASQSVTGAPLTGSIKWPGSSFSGVGIQPAPIDPTQIYGNDDYGSFPGYATVGLDVPSTLGPGCSTTNGIKVATVTGTITLGPGSSSTGGAACARTAAPFNIFPINGDPTYCGGQYDPLSITTGPDGALWFVNHNSCFKCTSTIGRMTTTGVVSIFSDPSIQNPTSITVGSDGALWFTNEFAAISNGGSYLDASIGRITTSGVVTNYSDATVDGPVDITAGPDGALWFTNQGYCVAGLCGYGQSIGRITTAGVVTAYPLPRTYFPNGITAGSDGNLWFTNVGDNSIGCITTSGAITIYTDPSISIPEYITAGPDGNLWFTNGRTGTIGRITTAGVVASYALPTGIGPFGITSGPDGALWFTGQQSIGRITTSGAVTAYVDPNHVNPYDVTPGPDGAMWFVDPLIDGIGRIAVP